jgi:Mitochondrial carrier protein
MCDPRSPCLVLPPAFSIGTLHVPTHTAPQPHCTAATLHRSHTAPQPHCTGCACTDCAAQAQSSACAGTNLPTVWQHVAASATAGVVNVAMTNPLWVVKTQLQAHGLLGTQSGPAHSINTGPLQRGVFRALLHMMRHEGLAGMYSGLAPSLVGIAHVAIQLPLYEYLKQEVATARGVEKDRLSTLDIFAASCVAKLVASTSTYPHEVVRSHMHVGGGGAFSGLIQTCGTVRHPSAPLHALRTQYACVLLPGVQHPG